MKAEREGDRFLVRLPEGLRDEIRKTANENFRSMNAEIVYRLAKVYSTKTKKADARA